MRTGVILVAVAAAAIGTAAQAQLFKCKGPDGKIVYSDSACEAAATPGALPAGVSNRAHQNEAKAAADKAAADKEAAERKAQAEALVEAAKKAGLVVPAAPAQLPAAPAAAAKGPELYQLTDADRERIRSLEIDASRQGASAEQRRAAQMEIASIRNGRDARISGADRSRRESLNADLSSADAKKRKQAIEELQSIYHR